MERLSPSFSRKSSMRERPTAWLRGKRRDPGGIRSDATVRGRWVKKRASARPSLSEEVLHLDARLLLDLHQRLGSLEEGLDHPARVEGLADPSRLRVHPDHDDALRHREFGLG